MTKPKPDVKPIPRPEGTRDIIALIGNTPLIPLKSLVADLPDDIQVLVKAEWMNPGGSVKDRPARKIVQEAMNSGSLKPGGVLLDASSGNTGIAYAMLAGALGFTLKLCLPKNANSERQRTLLAYGADLILTDPTEGSDGAILEAQRLAQKHPDWFYADQYGNDANWRAHFETTGPEIVQQTEGQLTHFVAAIGTTGTCTGTGRYLRQRLPQAQIVAVQPDSPFHGLEGMKHLETAIVPPIYDAAVPHQQRACATERAHQMVVRMAQEEGLLIGISAGALVATALDIAREEAAAGRPAVIVTIGCDGGERYLSETFWNNP